MKKVGLNCFLIILILLSNGFESEACTTFCLKDSVVLIFGRNFDFSTGFGHVILNKRNVIKTATIQPPKKPIEWISKYGSISFNQMGREFPYGGINEKGLVIEQMWLDETAYPEIDDRFGLSELQWIQYQLDNSATVYNVIASDSIVRVSKLSVAPLHFLVCDKKGNIATIEYLNGKMVYHTNNTLPITVLANDSYSKSTDYVKSFIDFGGIDSIPNTYSSLDRFARTASMIKHYKNQDAIDYSFKILEAVSQGNATYWSIVYDIINSTVYFKTLKNKTVRKFAISDFDFSCQSKSLFIDVEENMTNGKLDFDEYSYQSNRELIENVCNNVEFLESLTAEIRESTAKYPETTKCNE